jgi:plasmid stability protein
MSKHFYVYYSYEEWGRGYIGSRGCKCLPEEDVKYFGSFHDKTFRPTQKIILGVYKSRRDAYEAEILLHEFYDVARNPHFANQSRALVTGFTTEGMTPNKGKKASEETRKKIGAASKGRIPNEKTRQLKREQMLGEKNPMYGKTHTPEAREKIGAPHRGKTISEEHKERIRQANTGKTLSEEQKQKLREWERTDEYRKNLSNALKGRTFSEETKKKMSESAKKRKERERLEKLHHPHDTKE